MILTKEKMNWGHFAPRKRYIKDESGQVVATRYDRLYIGFTPKGRAWLESHYTGVEPVSVFMLGDKNVVFAYRAGDSVLYVNSKAGAQAMEYVKFYVDRLLVEKGLTVSVEKVDDFPTNVITRSSNGGVDSLDKAIAAACARDIDDLGI